MNNLNEPGTWLVNLGKDNVTDGPSGEIGQAIVEVIRLNTTSPHFIQRLTMKESGKLYSRCNDTPNVSMFKPWYGA